jgi:hypothetical protein
MRRGLVVRSVLTVVVAVVVPAAAALAQAVRLAEPSPDGRAYSVQSEIKTTGKVFTAKAGGGREELPLSATVQFEFAGRKLPPAGRDAAALRELREFAVAQLTSSVSGHETQVQLPADRQLVVAAGAREGIISYSPQGPLSRETADLLEIPGDPLALLATLPQTDVREGEEWSPADWVLQMLTGIEAVESAEFKCRLEQAHAAAAKTTFRGKIKGQRLGTNTSVEVAGVILFNREQNYLSQAKVTYGISSDVGAVNPGLDMQVTTTLTRLPAAAAGKLTDEILAGIPLSAPGEAFWLVYDAAPWGLQLQHSRDWHLFQAVYDGGAPVAILRLMEDGSLLAQCNLSPAPSLAPGETTPLKQFESDIQQSLGERFGEIAGSEEIPAGDGRKIYRVAATGNVVIKSVQGRADIPMTWIYYLVSSPQGRQASFVFAVESKLLPQLKDRDRRLVESLRFTAPKR